MNNVTDGVVYIVRVQWIMTPSAYTLSLDKVFVEVLRSLGHLVVSLAFVAFVNDVISLLNDTTTRKET